MQFALNHMTVARMGFAGLLDAAARLGCMGIELRNDLPGSLFDGLAPERAAERIAARGLRLLALAEVKRFDDWSDDRAAEALALIRTARTAGAGAVSLIPCNDGQEAGGGLRRALAALRPMLDDHGLVGLIEPLGFVTCTLRHKAAAVDAIEALGARATFRLVHDTFHHALAGETALFPAHTGVVHVSGVSDPAPARDRMRDADRGLVDTADRLGNLDQLRALRAAGWDGPVSLECFAPRVHGLDDPVAAIAVSIRYLRDGLAETGRGNGHA